MKKEKDDVRKDHTYSGSHGRSGRSEKKYKGRRAYLNDFKLNDKGEYNYEGILYAWAGEKEAYRSTLLTLWVLGVLQMIMSVSAGFVEAPGIMDAFYVILPYIISMVAGVSVLWAVIRMTEGKVPLRAYVYKASVAALPVRSLIVMIAAGIAAVGEICYVIANGTQGKTALIVLFIVLEAVTVISSIGIFKKVQNMPWEIQNM